MAMAPASPRPAGASICGERAAGSDAATIWLARIAGVLRAKGHMISTASLIEAERLAQALAAIRERPEYRLRGVARRGSRGAVQRRADPVVAGRGRAAAR